MKAVITVVLFTIFQTAFSQQDTITVIDYTKVLVRADSDGNVEPITSLEGVGQAGFFMNGVPKGQVRICHPDKLFVWINGRLLTTIEECEFIDPARLFRDVQSDTIYVSLSTKNSLEDLTCDLVIFEELTVIKDQIAEPRQIRSVFVEFAIIALIILLIVIGVIISNYASRVSYLFEKTFTFKVSAYEFVNTGFFSGASMYLLVFYALALSFSGLYLNSLLELNFFENSVALVGYLIQWVRLAVIVFSLFIFKWIMVSLVSQLFKFRGLRNFQLFDFVNFNFVLLLPILIFLVTDFIFNTESQSWISSGFLILFPIIIILFVVWFTLKFVNNSPRKKLVIISYLCATEIIPLIILLGWFYK
jgi:hypothetical protein